MASFWIDLRYETEQLTSTLSNLSLRILLLEKGEEKTRLTLTDADLTGRDVMTLISETNEIELFNHKYVEKLADEVWDGPYRVERSPLWLCSSAIALSNLF